jgi:transcriptional regulator with PAS, ATPase and Fis domain
MIAFDSDMQKELWAIFTALRDKHQNWHGALHEMETMLMKQALEESKTKSSTDIAKRLGLERTTFVMKKKRANLT